MKNIQYQQKAVSELVEKTIGLLSLSGNRHTLVFKAPTGSGKTVMASDMLMRLNDELLNVQMHRSLKWHIFGLHQTNFMSRVISR